jgi:diaminopimelate epimerase
VTATPPRLHKYQALGNDYLVVERGSWAPWDRPEVTRRLCDRRFGIGADGILVRATGDSGDATVETVRILNADGSEAEKSGNGLRIFARYLFDSGRVGEEWFEARTLAGVVRCQVSAAGASVAVVMGKVSFGEPRRLSIADEDIDLHPASIGNPHGVVFTPEARESDIRRLGPVLEVHPSFPQGTNVQLLQVLARDRVRLEIWERGSGYTWSSGSCASAGAAVAFRLGLVDEELQVEMRGGVASVDVGADFEVTLRGAVEAVATVEPAADLLRQL